jgi:hypothetical protein
LPIGNLTSQFLANLHLNALDHRLAALPGITAHLRYVDRVALKSVTAGLGEAASI